MLRASFAGELRAAWLPFPRLAKAFCEQRRAMQQAVWFSGDRGTKQGQPHRSGL